MMHHVKRLAHGLSGAWLFILLWLLPACVVERIEALLEEHGVTWVEDSSSTGSTSSTSELNSSSSSSSSESSSTEEISGTEMTTTDGDTSLSTAAEVDTTEVTGSTDGGGPACGDGVVEGDETCDDGNDDPSDGCKLCTRDSVVFATSEIYQGGKLNGLDGADQRCRMRAAIAGLSRFETYRAWLSDSGTSAGERLLHSRGRYVLVNGLVVAEDWEGLTSGALLRPIDVNENSETQAGGAWTGTLPNGERAPGSTLCDDWTDHSMGQKAGWGVPGEASMYWSYVENSGCGSEMSLYCIEQ